MSLRWLIREHWRFLKLRDYRSGSERIVGEIWSDGECWTASLRWNSRSRRPVGMSKIEKLARQLVVQAVQSEVFKEARLQVLKDQYWRGRMRSDGIPAL